MLTCERQTKLDLILNKLRGIPGVETVQSDDFDSASINLFICLKRENRFKLIESLCATKSRIRKILHEVSFNFLDWPVKRRSYNGKIAGRTIWFDEGYDSFLIKLEIFV
jgi:hypothetical protein